VDRDAEDDGLGPRLWVTANLHLQDTRLTGSQDERLGVRLDGHWSRQYNALVKRRLIAFLIVASLGSGSVAAMAPPAYAFTGHRCTISTCTFFTSSYSTARYYYESW
jgi:hypothetical protein